MKSHLERLKTAFETLKKNGVVHSQKDFAELLGYSRPTISMALSGAPASLTDTLLLKAESAAAQYLPATTPEAEPDIVIPAATAKMYADMAESIRILSELVAAQQKGAGKESPAASGF